MILKSKITWIVIVLTVLIIAGCGVSQQRPDSDKTLRASVDDDFDLLEEEFTQQAIEIADPLEPLNRIMYHINDALYFWVIRPVTQLYTDITPEPVRIGIHNFFHNLTTPIRFVSCHFQGKTEAAGIELNRFLINSTVGILGFGDPAKDQHGLTPPQPEDLGQSLATHGIGNGFYIVWPILGPSTARDSVGMLGGYFLNPVCYVEPTETAISISAARFINDNSFHLGQYEAFKSSALDPYVAMREIYIQYRNKQIEE